MLLQNAVIDALNAVLEESFRNIGTDINLIDVLLVLFWSIILSLIIAITYRGTHRGISYSQNFTQNLVIIGCVVGMVMLIIGTNIARAFTLVGALSIIRFRTAIKDPKDVGFIFFVMAVGMACGTKFYPVAIITTFVGCGLIYFMTYTQFGQKGLAQDILELYFPTEKDYAKILSPIFIRHLKYYSLLSVDMVDKETNRLSFIVTFKKKRKLLSLKDEREAFDDKLSPKSTLLKELQQINYISNVKVIEGSSSIEL
ncbi:MAG: DUF4956 domain-containing protein [Candidatus Lokiarchaeota archaeon]|nr:DUF4956 domain-containing protein [Candidatus Lokiarchaeota archaeon]